LLGFAFTALLGVFVATRPLDLVWEHPVLWVGLSWAGGALLGLVVGLLAPLE